MREIYRAGHSAPLSPVDIQSFANEADRQRLSAVALRAFRSLAQRWKLSNGDAAALLGVSQSTWERFKRPDHSAVLSQDQLTRVSATVGLFKGLNLLFADDMADRWVNLQNNGPLFERKTPIQAMIDGGIPRMLEVRRYIDAVRGGL